MNSVLDRHTFQDGDYGDLNEIPWRVRKGGKSDGDLVLQVFTDNGWRLVPLSLLALVVDFFCQNEPRVKAGYRSEKVIEHCRLAHRSGWKHAAAVLETEKTLARIGPPQSALFDWEAEGIFAEAQGA